MFFPVWCSTWLLALGDETASLFWGSRQLLHSGCVQHGKILALRWPKPTSMAETSPSLGKERDHGAEALGSPQALGFLAWVKYLSGLLPLQHFQKRSLECLVLACPGFMPHQETIRLD